MLLRVRWFAVDSKVTFSSHLVLGIKRGAQPLAELMNVIWAQPESQDVLSVVWPAHTQMMCCADYWRVGCGSHMASRTALSLHRALEIRVKGLRRWGWCTFRFGLVFCVGAIECWLGWGAPHRLVRSLNLLLFELQNKLKWIVLKTLWHNLHSICIRHYYMWEICIYFFFKSIITI